MSKFVMAVTLAVFGAAGGSLAVHAQQGGTMTFFVTSVGPGKGADLGGLEGADLAVITQLEPAKRAERL